MSKKKNTLKDLDDFLKQQAAVLVAPEELSKKVAVDATPTEPVVHEPVPDEVSVEKILRDLKRLSVKEQQAFRSTLYAIIIKSLEEQPQSFPEDKMLINTALYLKGGAQWKDTIRKYWREKPL